MNENESKNEGLTRISIPKLQNLNHIDEQGQKIVNSFHFYLIIVNILLILFNVMLTEYLW